MASSGIAEDLRHRLGGFRPSADTAHHLEAMRILASRSTLGSGCGDDPLARNCYAPGHFTASALLLSPDGRRLLLIHHRKLGAWLQPGGHLEPEDVSVESAARRELVEETSVAEAELLDGLVDVDVHRIPPVRQQPVHLHHDLRVLFRARTVDFHASPEVQAARWFSREEIEREPRTDESVRRVARRVLES